MSEAVTRTNSQGWPVRRGKVRDIYDLGDRLLMISTRSNQRFRLGAAHADPGQGTRA